MPRPKKPVDEAESAAATNSSKDTSFLYSLGLMVYGLLMMGLSFGLMIVGVALLAVLISTPIAILLQVALGVPVDALPLIGGLAALGLTIFENIWWVAEILVELSLGVFMIVILILLFSGQLDDFLP